MAKNASMFVCGECGHQTVRWLGRCPGCDSYGTLTEQTLDAPASEAPPATFVPLDQVDAEAGERFSSGIGELDRVLGGGIVPGSYLLLAGDPGAGKSTLAAELLLSLAHTGRTVRLVCGEESPAQVRLRFARVNGDRELPPVPVSADTDCDRICAAIEQERPDLICVDSVQTIASDRFSGVRGSVSQLRGCADLLLRAAKSSGTTVLLIGQQTKNDQLAGPRSLEHAVDCYLSLGGDRSGQLRLLRAQKNRFGSTDELAVFTMTGHGLDPVADPSQLFRPTRPRPLAGAATACVIEGSRPLLCEIQALAVPSNAPMPRRVANGIDTSRLAMLLAVLQRRCGLRIASHDIYVNVAAGLRIAEPAADIAVCLAVASALSGRPVRETLVAAGEVSLLGEAVEPPQQPRRQREAQRQGLELVPVAGPLDQLLEQALEPAAADALAA
jgi:DNA repair protein RadA/Sms